jgi:hypothetical protein
LIHMAILVRLSLVIERLDEGMKIVAEGVPLARLPGPTTTQRLVDVLKAIVGPPVIVGLGV